MDYIDEVREYLILPPAKKMQVLRELDLHYQELKQGLVDSGMNEADAAAEASRKFGDPARLAKQLYRVHCPASQYLWLAIGLLLLSLCLAQFSVVGLFLPMIDIINNLASESGPAPVHSFGPALPASAIAATALLSAGLTLYFAIRGAATDVRRRVIWWIILILAALVVLQSIAAVVIAPKFEEMFRDLGNSFDV